MFILGALWTPVKGPKTDDEGKDFLECQNTSHYTCNLHLSQQLSSKYPSTRSIPILSSKSAIGIVMGSGNMGQNLREKNNVFVSADAGLSWHQVLKGSYYFFKSNIMHVQILQLQTNLDLWETLAGIPWHHINRRFPKIEVFNLWNIFWTFWVKIESPN